MKDLSFAKVIEEHFPLLEQYTPVLVRVHGEGHPELAKVYEIFQRMEAKVKAGGAGEVDLTQEFLDLREATSNYSIPSDACETYTATYEMLEEADKAYNA